MKTDKVIKQVYAGLMAIGGMMTAVPSLAATVTTSADKSRATITIPVTISNPHPTCNLKLNGRNTSLSYELGAMAPGTKMVHPAFTASVECPGSIPVKTAITATLVSGGRIQSGDEDIRLDIEGVSGNTPLLWLRTEAGRKIKFTGLEKDAFCVKGDTLAQRPNVCQLHPVTDIPSQSPTGDFNASVQLTVVYPQ
ncbi:hypothetical protein LZN99_004223 [Escherichia coli]|nr:hypothetical protein [Escherichia coli]